MLCSVLQKIFSLFNLYCIVCGLCLLTTDAAVITSGYISRTQTNSADFSFATPSWTMSGRFSGGTASDNLYPRYPLDIAFIGLWGPGDASGMIDGINTVGSLYNQQMWPDAIFQVSGRVLANGSLTLRGTFELSGTMWWSSVERCYICGEHVTGQGVATFTLIPFEIDGVNGSQTAYESQWLLEFIDPNESETFADKVPEPSSMLLLALGLIVGLWCRRWISAQRA